MREGYSEFSVRFYFRYDFKAAEFFNKTRPSRWMRADVADLTTCAIYCKLLFTPFEKWGLSDCPAPNLGKIIVHIWNEQGILRIPSVPIWEHPCYHTASLQPNSRLTTY